MNFYSQLGFLLVLLPIPIALLTPVAAGASPDPRMIRFERWTVVGFALFIALIYTVLLLYQIRLWQGDPPMGEHRVDGVLIWSIMVWFYLVGLIRKLRRPIPEPVPGPSRRSASLVPRHAQPPVPRFAWWTLAATSLVVAAVLIASRPALPVISWVFLAAVGFHLLLCTYWARNDLAVAEMLPEPGEGKLEAALVRHRHICSWVIFAVAAFMVVFQLSLAVVYSSQSLSVYDSTVTQLGLAVLAVLVMTYLVFGLPAYRLISQAASGTKKGL